MESKKCNRKRKPKKETEKRNATNRAFNWQLPSSTNLTGGSNLMSRYWQINRRLHAAASLANCLAFTFRQLSWYELDQQATTWQRSKLSHGAPSDLMALFFKATSIIRRWFWTIDEAFTLLQDQRNPHRGRDTVSGTRNGIEFFHMGPFLEQKLPKRLDRERKYFVWIREWVYTPFDIYNTSRAQFVLCTSMFGNGRGLVQRHSVSPPKYEKRLPGQKHGNVWPHF